MEAWPTSRWSPGEFPAYLAMTAIATYACVPETDQMRAIGLMVLSLGIIEIITSVPSGPAVQVTAIGIVAWSGLYGATGRDSAIVGALFAFWPLVMVVGADLWLRRRKLAPARRTQRLLIGLVGGGAAIAVARTGALDPTIGPALLAVAVAAPISIGIGALVVRPTDRTARPG